jgi:hypothetical protein
MQGPRGLQGVQGEQGIQGIQGEPGVQGEPGIQGVQGEQGLRGETGEQGARGQQGNTGETGPQGESGVAGENLGIMENFANMRIAFIDKNDDSHFEKQQRIIGLQSDGTVIIGGSRAKGQGHFERTPAVRLNAEQFYINDVPIEEIVGGEGGLNLDWDNMVSIGGGGGSTGGSFKDYFTPDKSGIIIASSSASDGGSYTMEGFIFDENKWIVLSSINVDNSWNNRQSMSALVNGGQEVLIQVNFTVSGVSGGGVSVYFVPIVGSVSSGGGGGFTKRILYNGYLSGSNNYTFNGQDINWNKLWGFNLMGSLWRNDGKGMYINMFIPHVADSQQAEHSISEVTAFHFESWADTWYVATSDSMGFNGSLTVELVEIE